MNLKNLHNLLKTMTLDELKQARKIVNQYYQEKKKVEAPQRLVDTYTNQYGIYFRLEKVFCNKKNCTKCKGEEQQGHGPYWYSYKNGKREYVGKKIKKDLEEIKKFSKLLNLQNNSRMPYKS